MSIKIKSIVRKNPRDLEAPAKYYALAVNQGELSLKSLSEEIALMSTVSKTDVYAVLMALTELVPRSLGEGKIVRLDSLGSFSVNVSSTPSDTEEEVGAHNVKKLKLRFRPSSDFKKTIENFNVEKM